MHQPADFSNSAEPLHGPWWKLLNRYHWYVFIVAALGWLFDTMDQRIFIMSRQKAMTELLGYARDEGNNLVTIRREPLTEDQRKAADKEIKWYSGAATTVFMLGWATGGLFFGVMGDRWGRARTMLLTILIYSLFTGLSALSVHWWDFMIYRFITGLGVGGEFAAGISLVAEVMPDRARPYAAPACSETLSAVGNIIGSLLSWVIYQLAVHVPGRNHTAALGGGGPPTAQGTRAVRQRARKRPVQATKEQGASVNSSATGDGCAARWLASPSRSRA
ncbi:MAG: MFS transporter [Planctomycetota bacterium]